MEGATSSAYRWAISVPIRRSRGKKGGGDLEEMYIVKMKKDGKLDGKLDVVCWF